MLQPGKFIYTFKIKNKTSHLQAYFKNKTMLFMLDIYFWWCLELDIILKPEAQWAEPVSLTFHSALRKLNTEPPIGPFYQVLVIRLSSYREEDI